MLPKLIFISLFISLTFCQPDTSGYQSTIGFNQSTTGFEQTTTGSQPYNQDWIKRELREIKLYIYQLKLDIEKLNSEQKNCDTSKFINKVDLLNFFKTFKGNWALEHHWYNQFLEDDMPRMFEDYIKN